MALQKPLVEVGGEIQALQPGDSLDSGSDDIAALNTAITVPGNVMYADSSTSVNLAQGNAPGTSIVVGLAKIGTGAGGAGIYVHDGILALTTIQWDAVAGTTGGLLFNSKYYLSDSVPGALFDAAGLSAVTQGEFVVELGKALSPTELLVKPQPRIER